MIMYIKNKPSIYYLRKKKNVGKFDVPGAIIL